MSLNLYSIAGVLLVIIALIVLLSGRYMWSLPFFGGAAALYFIGKSNELEGGDR